MKVAAILILFCGKVRIAFRMEKAKIIVKREGGKTEEIQVLVNPSEYNLKYSPKYSKSDVLGGSSQISNFVGNNSPSLSMTLYVDGYIMARNDQNPCDINLHIKKLLSTTSIDPKLHRPPICLFIWGSLCFEGMIEALSFKYTMFENDGMPVRATVDITFCAAKEKNDKIAFESPDRTKQRTIIQDTQLYMLSYECYGDCGQWRHIAKANGIKNPREVYPGQSVQVPAISL